MSINWQRLTDPFDPKDIEWKPGATTRDKSKGLAMAYITARAVQERLDEVFGPGNWKNEFRAGPEGGVLCRIYFKNDDGEWVWREDGADNTDVEAVKGGLSNAMKRGPATDWRRWRTRSGARTPPPQGSRAKRDEHCRQRLHAADGGGSSSLCSCRDIDFRVCARWPSIRSLPARW